MPSLSTKGRGSKAGEPQLLLVEDLSGGLDLRRTPSLVQANRARRLRNWSLREPGALVVFPGWQAHSTAALGVQRGQGGQRVYLSTGSPFTLYAWNGGVYKVSDVGVNGSPVLSGLNTSNQIYFPYDRDMVVALDGEHTPKKSTNGIAWSQMGIDAPASAPTAAAVAGGSLIDGSTYEFSYSGQDDELVHEGNESAVVTQNVGTGNLTVRLTLAKHPDAQVDTLNVYARDVTAGESLRRRVGQVANPAGASVTYDVTANTWSAGNEAPYDHDVPAPASFAVLWKNRWWFRDPTVKNRIRFTQIFDPQSAPALYYIDIPFERGDEASAFVASGDTLVVFGQASKPFLIIGQTSLDFEVRPSAAAEAGALGPRAVDLVENGIIHAAAEGVYIFDGASDRLLSYDIDPGWRDMVTHAVVSDLQAVAVEYHRLTKEVRIAVPRLYPYSAAGEWVLDLNRTRIQEQPAWTSTDRTIGGYIHWDGNEPATGDRGRLFSWSNTIGRLYEESVGSTANGADVVADYEGPAFESGLQMARGIDFHAEYEPNAGTLGFEILVDGRSRSAPSLDTGEGFARYGAATYGSSTYAGSGRRPYVSTLPLEAEGRMFTVRASYRGQGAFKMFTYGVTVIIEPLPRGL
jgi:hypothetical protein